MIDTLIYIAVPLGLLVMGLAVIAFPYILVQLLLEAYRAVRQLVVVHRALRASRQELSCGYEVDLEETAGTTPDGERYDAIQRGRRKVHLAIVPSGRERQEIQTIRDGEP